MEEELVNSAKAGDNEAFYSLISLYKSKLYNTAYCYLKNEVDSLEAIQEVTCRAYIKLNKVKEPKYFGTWIMRILINYCIDEQKRKKKFIYQEKDHSIENNEFNLDNTLIEAAINKLKPKYKNAIILKYFQDMSIQEISPKAIEQYIRKGISLGIKRKHKNNIKVLVNIAAMISVIIFITSIRISPVFAGYVSKIPGLSYIVNLINYDKGIKAIVDNNFVQNVNMTTEKEGLVVTVKDIIIDNSKVIIFYFIEDKGKHRFIGLDSFKIMDIEEKPMDNISISYGGLDQDMSINKKVESSIEIDFYKETIIPEKLKLEFKFRESLNSNDPLRDKGEALKSIWNIEVPIDKSKFRTLEENYTINQSAQVQGQKILFKTTVITPTRIAVDVEFDINNTKKILNFEDIAIVNEKGEKWGIINGNAGTRADDNHNSLFFQSSYFSKSKELYLEGTSIQAVDKDKAIVIVDTENNTLINAPDDKLKLISITKNSNQTKLKFSLEKDKVLDFNRLYSIFYSIFKAGDGKTYESNTGEFDSRESGVQNYEYDIAGTEKFQNPIYLTIIDYPTRIKGNFKIKIK